MCRRRRLAFGLAIGGLLLLVGSDRSLAEPTGISNAIDDPSASDTPQPLGCATNMQIKTINGVKVDGNDPSEVYIPPNPTEDDSFAIVWEDNSVTLGIWRLEAYVDGTQLPCDNLGNYCNPAYCPDECRLNSNLESGSITLDPDDFPGCAHSVEVIGFSHPDPGQGCFDVSPTETFWFSPHKECGGVDDCTEGNGKVGQPIEVATGNMYYEVTDLEIPGPLPMTFSRRYESQSDYNGVLGPGWHHTYLMRLEDDSGRKVFIDENGREIYFTKGHNDAGNPVWAVNRIERLSLEDLTPPNPEWLITDKHLKKYEFDSSQRLTRVVDRNGNAITLSYEGSELTSITDSFGRAMTLTYDTNDRLETVSAGDRTVKYTYDGSTGNLELVEWLVDSTVVNHLTYEYEDMNDAQNLTAVRDASGNLIESHTYDREDRVETTESEGGNFAYTLSYDTETQTTVTNALDDDTVFTHDAFSGLVTTSSGPGCTSCGEGNATSRIYDRLFNVVESTDALGVKTKFNYFPVYPSNLKDRIEASGNTSLQRTTSYTYDLTFLVKTITRPSVGTCTANTVTTNTYYTSPPGSYGNVQTQTVTGCHGATAFSHTTSYTYNGQGQVLTVNGPRTDITTDITTYEYYPLTESVEKRGRLKKITDAVGNVTLFEDYDLFGNAGSVTDPNGVKTTFIYDHRNQPLEVRVHGATSADDVVTKYTYDANGNLDKVRNPNCVEIGETCTYSLDYTFDEVNRLESVADALGNARVYTYDAEGNRTRDESQQSSAVRQFTNFLYDDHNRLQYIYHTSTVPPAAGAIFSKLEYYADGMLQRRTDPLLHQDEYTYDALKRTKTATREGPPDLATEFEYDTHDNLKKVTAPNDTFTDYTWSDAGWPLTESSEDRGDITYVYDKAGNLTSRTDPTDTVIQTYDAVNRLLTIDHSGTAYDVSFGYDSTAVSFGRGRLTSMTDASGTTVYHYDRRGNIVKEVKTIAGVAYTTEYEYDKSGNLKKIFYPTNDPLVRRGEVTYTYDVADKVTAISALVDGAAATVASNIQYEPLGPVKNIDFGNGLSDDRTYDTKYRLINWDLAGGSSLIDYTHTYNHDDNLEQRDDNLNSAQDRTFGYDYAHRLEAAVGPWGTTGSCTGSKTYTYDANGNRLCKGEDSSATSYTYTANTNRLASATVSSVTTSYAYDDAGNTEDDGTHDYAYGENNRLVSVDAGSTASYVYDGRGRRAIKQVGARTTYFFYDFGGNLLSERVVADAAGKDYVSLQGAPVARVDWTTEADLGTVLVVDETPTHVSLDWSDYPVGSNLYVIRRKLVDPADKSFDGNTVIATVSDPTQTYQDNVFGNGNDYDYLVRRQAVNDTLFYFHTDHLGTSIAMTDSAGSLVWRAEHRPFGEVFSFPVDDIDNNLRFPGQYFDGETGLSQNYFRDYDPGIGRYREPDPIGFVGGINLYAYVGDNPGNQTDPDGLAPKSPFEPPGYLAGSFPGLTTGQPSRAQGEIQTAAMLWWQKGDYCVYGIISETKTRGGIVVVPKNVIATACGRPICEVTCPKPGFAIQFFMTKPRIDQVKVGRVNINCNAIPRK